MAVSIRDIAREAVITGKLPNERNALLAAVKIELDP